MARIARALRNQIVAGKTGLDRNPVAHPAQSVHIGTQYNCHIHDGTPLDRSLTHIGGVRGGVEEESHLARTLDLTSEAALALGTRASDTTGNYLATFRGVILKDISPFVVNGQCLVGAEPAVLFPGRKPFF